MDRILSYIEIEKNIINFLTFSVSDTRGDDLQTKMC